MSQPSAEVAPGRRGRPWWRRRRVVLPALLIASPFVAYFAADRLLWLGTERRYRAAVAEADRLDPGWREARDAPPSRPIPDEENSALLVLKAAKAIPANWSALGGEWIPYKFDPARPLPPYVEAEWSRRRDEAAPALADARALVDRPFGRFPERAPLFLDRVPDSRQAVLKVAGLLHLDALIRIQEGDLDGALVDIRATVNAGRSLDEPRLADQAGRVTAVVTAVATLERLLAQGQVSGPDLQALQSLLEDEYEYPLALICLRGERATHEAMMEEVRSGRADVNRLFDSPFPGFLLPLLSWRVLRENQADILEMNTKLVELARRRPKSRLREMDELGSPWFLRVPRSNILDRIRHYPAFELSSSSFAVRHWSIQHRASLALAILALASERFRLDRGRWPESPEELIPTYLKAMPDDPYGSGPIRRKRIEHGLTFYSVGQNGTDEGGTQTRGNPSGGADLIFQLDDPEVRGRAADSPP